VTVQNLSFGSYACDIIGLEIGEIGVVVVMFHVILWEVI
jgi:hypothetical protein